MTAHDLQHPIFARLYSRISRWLDIHGGSEHRQQLLAPLTGQVVEVGAGNGLNFRYYPGAVTRVVAIEPESTLGARAARAAASAPVPVHVISGRAEELPIADDHIDGAVLSLVLCSIAGRDAALAELRRVLKPAGIVRFYEHVRSPRRTVGAAQDVITPAWSRIAGGCRLNQDAVTALTAAGFEITEFDQFPFGVTHILGTARPR